MTIPLKLDKSKLKEVLDLKISSVSCTYPNRGICSAKEIQPVLEKYADLIGLESELKV